MAEEQTALEALREVVQRIEQQESCGLAEQGHSGCHVADSLSIAKDVLSRFEPQPCPARFIVERLADPVQDARMDCAGAAGHGILHRNAAGDLEWEEGAEVSLMAILSKAGLVSDG